MSIKRPDFGIVSVLALALAACTSGGFHRADTDLANLRIVSTDLSNWLTSLPRAGETSGVSPVETEQCLEAFGRGLRAAIQREFKIAQEQLVACDYTIGRVVEADRSYIAIFEDEPTTVGATIVIAAAATTDLIVEAPHPIFENATVQQVAMAMRSLDARAAIVAGAHRCASKDVSPCSGKTSVCGQKDAPYPVSDVAHHTGNIFHTAHQILAALSPTTIVIQFHVMGPNENTKVVVSDSSTREDPTDVKLTGSIRDALRSELDGSPESVVSCHDKRDRQVKFRRLCGTANVQARQMYGSSDACNIEGSSPTGRFIHLEQYFEILESESGRAAILNGLRKALNPSDKDKRTPL